MILVLWCSEAIFSTVTIFKKLLHAAEEDAEVNFRASIFGYYVLVCAGLRHVVSKECGTRYLNMKRLYELKKEN